VIKGGATEAYARVDKWNINRMAVFQVVLLSHPVIHGLVDSKGGYLDRGGAGRRGCLGRRATYLYLSFENARRLDLDLGGD